MEKRITLARLGGYGNTANVKSNFWECCLCEGETKKKTLEVTEIMIHLFVIHGVRLEWQNFPQGILQSGNVFAIAVKTCIPVNNPIITQEPRIDHLGGLSHLVNDPCPICLTKSPENLAKNYKG